MKNQCGFFCGFFCGLTLLKIKKRGCPNYLVRNMRAICPPVLKCIESRKGEPERVSDVELNGVRFANHYHPTLTHFGFRKRAPRTPDTQIHVQLVIPRHAQLKFRITIALAAVYRSPTRVAKFDLAVNAKKWRTFAIRPLNSSSATIKFKQRTRQRARGRVRAGFRAKVGQQWGAGASEFR